MRAQHCFFYIDGETKFVPVTPETADRVNFQAMKEGVNLGEIQRRAYAFAKEKGEKELTDESINEYLDTLGTSKDVELNLGSAEVLTKVVRKRGSDWVVELDPETVKSRGQARRAIAGFGPFARRGGVLHVFLNN